MSVLQTHAAVRVQPFSGDKWCVRHITDRKEFVVSSLIAAMIVLLFKGENLLQIKSLINETHFINSKQFYATIQLLLDSNIILEANNKEQENIKEIISKWNKFGWLEAADYHLATFDYPFIDDENNNYRRQDNSKVQSYYLEAPDINRSKEFNNAITNISLLTPKEYLVDLNMKFKQIFTPQLNRRLDSKHIKMIASVTFGALRTRNDRQSYRAETIRKTSPSGGLRHPTEGYFFLLQDISDLQAGIYHFSISKQSLELINNLSDIIPKKVFPGVFRASFTPKVVIILTSIFEKNMYRYREPRTLRTIFIDTGHIAETIKLLCKGLNIHYFSHSYIEEDEVEKILKLRRLEEGVIYSVALS